MSLTFKHGSAEVEGRRVHCSIAELGNAVLALIWEGEEPVWGSTTVSLPGSVGTQVIGDRDQLVGRTLGGYLAKRCGKMAVVSTNLAQGYPEGYGLQLLDLVRRTLDGAGKDA